MWLEFTQGFVPVDNRTWSRRDYVRAVQWFDAPAPPGSPVGLHHKDGQPLVLAPDGHAIGLLGHPLNPNRRGLVRANVSENMPQLKISYLGPDDLWTD